MRATMISRGIRALMLALAVGSCARAHETLTPPDPTTVGDLPTPVDEMTGDSLWKVTRGLGWTKGRTQSRNCAQGSCDGRMDAVSGQEKLNADRISINGTIVARFVNKGAGIFNADRGPEARYGFSKSDGTEYLLIAVKEASAPDGWKWIVRVAFSNDQGLMPIRAGDWRVCQRHEDPLNHPPEGTKTQFYSCGSTPQNGQGVMRLAYNPNDPGWYDCEQGCCTAGLQ